MAMMFFIVVFFIALDLIMGKKMKIYDVILCAILGMVHE